MKSHIEPIISEQIDSITRKFQRSLNDKLTEMNIKEKASSFWNSIQDPHCVYEDTYLLIKPSELFCTPILAVADQLVINFGLRGDTYVVFDSAFSHDRELIPLPDTISTSERELESCNQFNLNIASKFTFEAMTNALNKHLADKDYSIKDIPTLGTAVFHVEDFLVSSVDGENKVQITVNVSGEYKGSFILQGTPRYNSENNCLFVEDFEFKQSFGLNKLANIKIKIADLFLHSKIVKKISEHLKFKLTHPLNKLQERGNLNLNDLHYGDKDQLYLSIEVTRISPIGVNVNSSGINTLLQITGTTEARLDTSRITDEISLTI